MRSCSSSWKRSNKPNLNVYDSKLKPERLNSYNRKPLEPESH